MGSLVIFWSINLGITIATNLSLLIFMVNKRKLHTASNVILISILITGLLFGIVYILPRFIIGTTYSILFVCKLFGYLGALFTVNINLHVCAISFDRFFAVVFPFRYRQIASKRASVLLCVIIWFISFLICAIPLITFDRDTKICLGASRIINETNTSMPTNLSTTLTTTASVLPSTIQSNLTTTVSVTPGTLSPTQLFILSWRIYLLFIFFVLFLFPLAVLIMTYGTMLFVVFTHAKKVHSLTVATTETNKPKSLIIQNRKALLQVALIIGAFLIFFLPYVMATVVFLINDLKFASEGVYTYSNITQLIAFSYPAVNPLLYAYYNKDISHEITKSFKSKSASNILNTDRTPVTNEKTTTA
ncbi:Histamine H2 receptor [Trichoplax sp. H2]|nr:Histamine H2 receptor [Trichoplax sp. H2]|eukprot:RDD36901.1 Histamine H2 receptor [Trichoplax sp. H2]